MPKGNQGFGSFGGRSHIPKNTTGGGYSAAEVAALSKVGATELGVPMSDPDHVVLCDVCGQPVAGSPNSDQAQYANEMRNGVHFKCFMAKESAKISAQKRAFDALSEEEKEEARAAVFNAVGATASEDTVLERPSQEVTDDQERARYEAQIAEDAEVLRKAGLLTGNKEV